MSQRSYRVAQWGTGHSGRRALQAVIEHPHLELVGVRVYSEDKIGKDAGEIAGLPLTGITATSRIEDILAAKPDCVLYFPATGLTNIDDMARLLEAGINIVTLVASFYYPPALDPIVREKLESACRRGQSSLFATGPNPGYASSTLPLGAISFQRRLDKVSLFEYANLESRTGDMNRVMWGWDPGTRDASMNASVEGTRRGFAEVFGQTAAAIGLPFDEVTAEAEVALATEAVTIANGMTIEKGTVAGSRTTATGWRNGVPLMLERKTFWATRKLDQEWQLRDRDGWHLLIEGDTPVEMDFYFAPYSDVGNSSGYNSHICVNAIPNTCEAKPGILTPAEMPPIVAQFEQGRK